MKEGMLRKEWKFIKNPIKLAEMQLHDSPPSPPPTLQVFIKRKPFISLEYFLPKTQDETDYLLQFFSYSNNLDNKVAKSLSIEHNFCSQ